MQTNKFIEELEEIFSDTLNWYKKERIKVAPSLFITGFLNHEITNLEEVRELCRSFFNRAMQKGKERENLLLQGKEGLANQEKTLKEVIAQKPEVEQILMSEYNKIIDTLKTQIKSTQASIKALEKLAATENRISTNNQQDVINTIRLFVSLKIKRVTFNKIEGSVRTIVTSIPGISNVINIVNGGYDLFKIWVTPIKDTKNAVAYMQWFEKRSELLNALKSVLRRNSWLL